jgi:hypothetical protein
MARQLRQNLLIWAATFALLILTSGAALAAQRTPHGWLW